MFRPHPDSLLRRSTALCTAIVQATLILALLAAPAFAQGSGAFFEEVEEEIEAVEVEDETDVDPDSSVEASTEGMTMVESIAAQVGSDIILASEVLELTSGIEEKMRAAGAPASEIVRIRRDALERLIEGKLLSSVVERLELTADREEVDTAIRGIAEENGLTEEELLASIQTHGLSIEEYREKIQEEIERSKFVNSMVRSRVQITDEEVEALYQERFGSQPAGGKEIRLRHILVRTEGPEKRSQKEACAIAEQARQEIATKGTPFGAVAQRVSDMNPRRGGELGWMLRKDLAGWMSDTVSSLEPGELSPVVPMPFGCNLLQVVDRREFTPVTFADALPALQNEIFNRKSEVEYLKWLDILRAQVYIERKGAFSAGNDDSAMLGGGIANDRFAMLDGTSANDRSAMLGGDSANDRSAMLGGDSGGLGG